MKNMFGLITFESIQAPQEVFLLAIGINQQCLFFTQEPKKGAVSWCNAKVTDEPIYHGDAWKSPIIHPMDKSAGYFNKFQGKNTNIIFQCIHCSLKGVQGLEMERHGQLLYDRNFDFCGAWSKTAVRRSVPTRGFFCEVWFWEPRVIIEWNFPGSQRVFLAPTPV